MNQTLKNYIFIFLFLSSFSLLSQSELTKSKLLDSTNLKIDSIKVNIFIYEDVILTESLFEKSKSKLSIVFWVIGKSSYKIITRENGPLPDDYWRSHEFHLKKGKIRNKRERFYFSGRVHGIAASIEEKYSDSFNKFLNSEFVVRYSIELLEKIKNIEEM